MNTELSWDTCIPLATAGRCGRRLTRLVAAVPRSNQRRSLRTSHATWLKIAGADVEDAQAQMRHLRPSTTINIYQQFVPESQRRTVDRLSTLVN